GYHRTPHAARRDRSRGRARPQTGRACFCDDGRHGQRHGTRARPKMAHDSSADARTLLFEEDARPAAGSARAGGRTPGIHRRSPEPAAGRLRPAEPGPHGAVQALPARGGVARHAVVFCAEHLRHRTHGGSQTEVDVQSFKLTMRQTVDNEMIETVCRRLEAALERSRASGESGVLTQLILENLAATYFFAGKYQEALAYSERCLNHVQQYPISPFQLTRALNNVAVASHH